VLVYRGAGDEDEDEDAAGEDEDEAKNGAANPFDMAKNGAATPNGRNRATTLDDNEYLEPVSRPRII
jgi:hypothetical protein